MPHECILSLFQCFLTLYILILCLTISRDCNDACIIIMVINNGGVSRKRSRKARGLDHTC